MGDLRLEIFKMWMKVHHIQCNLSFKIFKLYYFLPQNAFIKVLER